MLSLLTVPWLSPGKRPGLDSIREQTRENVARYASASPHMIEQRLKELAREWDVERVVELAISSLLLLSLLLPAFLGINWLIVPALFAALLFAHALLDWSPLVPVVAALGVRTTCEIGHERYALKALRGDFQKLDVVTTPQDREDLSRFEGEGGAVAPEPVLDASDPEIVQEALRAAKPDHVD